MDDKTVSAMLKQAGAPNVRPKGPRYLICIEEVEEITSAGIVLSHKQVQNEEYAAREATVLRCGSDKCNYHFYEDKNWADLGDKVLISVHAGEKLYTDDLKPTKFRIIDSEAILGVIQE